MKNYLLFLLVLLISCNWEKTNKANSLIKEDNPSYYFLKSQDLNLEVTDRLKAVNKAIEMTGGIDSHGFSGQLAYYKNWLHFSSGQNDSLNFYHHKAFEGLTGNIDNYYLGQEFYLMGYYFSEVVGNSEKAFRNYTLSKGYFLKIRDSSWVGRNLLNMGTIQKDKNDFFGSKETLTKALKYLNSSNDKTYIVQCYNLLATNHRKLLNFDDALTFYNKAIKLTDTPIDNFIYKNNLAVTYIDNHQLKLAINLLDSLSNISTPISNQKEYARVLDNLAYARWLSGDEITQMDFQNPLNIRNNHNDQRGQIASFTHLGEYYSKSYPKRAMSYFDSVIQLSKKIKIPRAEADALRFLMKIEPNNVGIRERYIFLQDSLYNQELKVKTQFAKYKYDDKVTQGENLRLEKEIAEQQLKVAEQESQKILFGAMAGILLLLALFAIYYLEHRSKRLKQQHKTAKLEATFETEEELSRKLHDDFGGKLNRAMLLLQNGAENEEVLNVIDELYNQSRDFSKEINDVDTGTHFKEYLIGMMGSYCKHKKMMVTGSNDVDWTLVSPLSKKVLFKVLRELMINMKKHSQASLVSVDFKQVKNSLEIGYVDNGIGVAKEGLYLKNGLWNTEKRIKAIKGTIIFDSEKGQGFEARIVLPH